MNNFIITSYTNSFEINKNGHGKEYQKGVLVLDIDPGDDQILEIRTTQARQILYKIDLSTDSIDVDGTTSFANSNVLRDAIRPFFFRDTSSGGDTPLIPTQNKAINFAALPPAGDHTNEIWYVENQTGTWIGSLVGVTRKQSGLYKSNGSTWEPTNDPLQYWTEGQISFKDSDGTGELLFNLDLTGSRNASWQDSDGVVSYLPTIVSNPVDPYTANNNEIIFVDCSSGNKTVNLPQLSAAPNTTINIKKIEDSTNTLTVVPFAGDLIEGENNLLMESKLSITIAPNGATWQII